MLREKPFLLRQFVFVLIFASLLDIGTQTFAAQKAPSEPKLEDYFGLLEQELAPIRTGVSRPLMKKDVPASVTVITAEELKLLGLRNLTDVINYIVPGGVGDIHRSTRTGLYAFRGITVDNNGKYVFMVDGINCGDLSMWGAFNERYLGLMDELERIEIIQGTGSILYGSGAISGIINFITKTGQDFQGTEATVGFGSWNKVETSLKYGEKISENNDSFYYAGYKNSKGTRPTGGALNNVTETAGPGRRVDHFDNSGKFHANIHRGDITLRMRYVRESLEEPYVRRGTIRDSSDDYRYQNYLFIQPEIVRKLSDVSSMKANISFGMSEAGYEKIEDWYSTGNRVAKKGEKTSTNGEKKIRAQLFHYYDGWVNHKFTSGLEGFWMRVGSDFDGQNYYIKSASGYRTKFRQITPDDLSFIAVFFEDIWRWTEKTTLFFGGRLENHSKTPVNFSPRIAISHDSSAKTNWKLLYNYGYRTPDQAYYSRNDQLTTAQEPRAERVHNFEGHFTHQFTKKVSLNTVAYYTIYKDLINYWTDTSVSPSVDHGYYNYPIVRAAGLEFTGNYRSENLLFQLSHSFSKPVHAASDNLDKVELTYDRRNWAQFPTNMTKAHAIITLVKEKCMLGLTYFRPWGIKGQQNAADDLKKAANYLNGTLTFKVKKNFELQLSGYNLTGENHPWWGAATKNGITRSVNTHTEWFVRMIWKF